MTPLELVELQFVPEGRTDPVVAVDRITAGSVPNLKEDDSVPITYQRDRPRIARMAGGKRDYGWANAGTLAMPWVLGFLFCSAVMAILIAVIYVYAKIAQAIKAKRA
jgi:hypothetical protein